MDNSIKKSTSLEVLVIQNIKNAEDLKEKLHDMIRAGKNYEYDVSACVKQLLNNKDQEIVELTLQAISELAKCDDKRETYAQKEIIEPILNILNKELCIEKFQLYKQSCRAVGNLCCDCDRSRKIILDNNGISILVKKLESTIGNSNGSMHEAQLLTSKTLLNFAIGGTEFSNALVEADIMQSLHKILTVENFKEDVDNDTLSTALLILSVISDNTPEIMFDNEVNIAVLNVLRETKSADISELCLDHLHSQAEFDSVKSLLAEEGALQLVCSRLELLMMSDKVGNHGLDETEIDSIIKKACDLIIIVLTGDESMHFLYKMGKGEVYLTMVRWLDCTNHHMMTTAVLAIGNFARKDEYCIQMMESNIFDKLLDIFEIYHKFFIRTQKEQDEINPIDPMTLVKIEHAVMSSLRNLLVPVVNKRKAAAKGRATNVFLDALPDVQDHNIAYKLLAAIRMLVDGQESVARALVSRAACVRAVCAWGAAHEHAGAAGEAPRLLAWTLRLLRHGEPLHRLLQIDGCIKTLVNMLVNPHTLMQNEAILSLTLLAIEALNKKPPQGENDFDSEKTFTTQLVNSEIGKHIDVLIKTNNAKMPVEEAENLLAFLDITSKKNEVCLDYKEAGVHEALLKFMEVRTDLSDDLKSCVNGVISIITGNGGE